MSSDGDSAEGTGALGAVSSGLDALSDALGSGEDTQEAREGVDDASEAVRGATELVGAAQNVMGIADGLAASDAGGTLSSLGGLSGDTAGLTDAVAQIVPAGEARDALRTAGQVARGVQSAAQALGGLLDTAEHLGSLFGPRARAVTYHFEHEAFPDHDWRVEHVHVEEALNEPYRATIRVATDDSEVDLADLLGRGCLLVIERSPVAHRFPGIVLRVDEGSQRANELATRATVELVPALALLDLRTNTRIFQDETVPDILESVLRDGVRPYRREIRTELDARYLRREYCVQYQETDLAFVHRLMEEEGISYSFENDDGREVLLLRDSNRVRGEVETLDGNPVPYLPNELEVSASEPIHAFHPIRRLVPTSTTARDVDWTRQGSMRLEAHHAGDDRGPPWEVYEHGRSLTITDYSQAVQKYQANDASQQAQVRQELHGRDALSASGLGRVIGFGAGLTFEMSGHPNLGADGTYLLTRVIHESTPREGGQNQNDPYHNQFTCIPADTPFRPDRVTPKPRIPSTQTAVVVGPGSEEIHTDEHGRVKVQFHWDRQGTSDDRSSCWIRVQQPWAGSGWGFSFIPRVGMEVVVSFLDGDPDRPLVVGSVYNGTNRPPYTLPDEKTKSTIKTSSSPHSGGSNELRFDDKAGHEEIYVHAERDYNELIEHNHSTRVKANQSNSVGGNQGEAIGRNQTISVEKDQSLHVKGERTTKVERNETVHVTQNRTRYVGGTENVTIDQHRHMKLTKGNWSLTTAQGTQHFSSKGEFSVTQNEENKLILASGAALKSPKTTTVEGGNAVRIGSDTQVVIEVGASSITVTPGAIVLSSPIISIAGIGPVQITPMVLTPTVINAGGPARGSAGATLGDHASGASDAGPSDVPAEERRAREHARLARAVYDDEPSRNPPPGWEVVEVSQDDESGYRSVLYRSTDDPSRFVLAYRGTDPESGRDWATDGAQGAGAQTRQYDLSTQAADRAQRIAQENGGTLELTGHSLGGGLAGLNGMRTGAPTTTFNAAGVHDNARRQYGVLGGPEDNITNYSTPYDPVTQGQERFGMPTAPGNQRTVVPRDEDGEPTSNFNPIGQHSMENVERGLEHGRTGPRERRQWDYRTVT